MPPRWLPLLALTIAGLALGGGANAQEQFLQNLPSLDAEADAKRAQGLEQPPSPPTPLPQSRERGEVRHAEPLPSSADLETTVAAPPTSPCESLIPAMPNRPRWVPDYFQFLVGGSYTSSIGPSGPTLDFVPINARLGWYLTDPMAPGAVSVLVGNTSGIVTKGFGSYFTGPSLAVRYERRPDRDLVPYFQIGSGLAFNDAYKVKTQRAIGSVIEFCDQFEGGVRYRLTANMSLDFEVAYQHISNAGFAGRNSGINNLAFMGGFTYTFGCR